MGEFNYDLSQTFPEIPWVVNQQVSNTSLPVFYVTAALFYFFFLGCLQMAVQMLLEASGRYQSPCMLLP